MGGNLVLNELAVEAARTSLIEANLVLSSRELRKPAVTVQSLGDVAAQLDDFVNGLDTARRTLRDSARAGSVQLSVLLVASDELDGQPCGSPGNASGGE